MIGFKVEEGSFAPQGVQVMPSGVNFALYSRNATAVELCLFDSQGQVEPSLVVPMRCRDRFVWHCTLAGCGPGQLYLYRVDGPWVPREGHRFNRNKYLLDPYARAITGKHDWSRGDHHAWDRSSGERDLSFSPRSNIEGCPKCVVADGGFDWAGDSPPRIPMNRTIIYEMHLGGFTKSPSSCVSRPGTYLGAIEKIPYLLDLGVNAVELLPIQECVIDEFLSGRGLTNWWGYNTIGFFAPDSRFKSGRGPADQVVEFKTMVREFHRAGIEVILDVVYNHTGEGNHEGPSLCFRGIDNATYYQILPEDGRRYRDFTGCGNTFNFDNAQVIKFVMDSLRYWVREMHVDGFRFDLASALGRRETHFNRLAAFFVAAHQDPVLSAVKLIAEPWDVGADSYQVGNFPEDWAEWNGRFRDTVRRFVRGDAGMLRDLGCRLTGSSDLYGDDGRSPYHSINFVTCHDGFTLNDLVSYGRKHNEENGEGNRDGNDCNDSAGHGAEGVTDDAGINAIRRRQAKNLMLILALSRGVPMILAGDEFLRTQGGNNNAYCHDSPLNWLDWDAMERERAGFYRFTQMLLNFRSLHPVLERARFLEGRDLNRDGVPDIGWFGPDGSPVRWDDPESRALAFRLDGSESSSECGDADSDVMVMLNAGTGKCTFSLPAPSTKGAGWHRVADTSLPDGEDIVEDALAVKMDPPGFYIVNERTCVVLISR
jgi:glycogen operon protein